MGLYDEDRAAIVGGPVDAERYWRARAAAEQLELALATEQPWNAIASWLPRAIEEFDLALEEYPHHADIRAWKEKALGIDAPVDPDRNDDWGEGFCWAQRGYALGWVALHWARFAARELDPPNWRRAREQSRKAEGHLATCSDVDDWPEAARTFLEEGLDEMRRLSDEAWEHR